MPTFKDVSVDADEAREALRGLAHASHRITDAQETYRVLGSLSAGLLSLQQALDQLAGWHERNADHAASDGGERDAGRRDAVAAGDYLREAAGRVRQAHSELRAAFNHSGRIAWRCGIDASLTRRDGGRGEPARFAPTSAARIEACERQVPGSLGR